MPDASAGEQVYREACAFCHGSSGQGGHGGVPLRGLDVAAVERVVRTGGVEMPSLGSSLTPDEIVDVSAFVAERFR